MATLSVEVKNRGDKDMLQRTATIDTNGSQITRSRKILVNEYNVPNKKKQ